jgi:hypothetical protein
MEGASVITFNIFTFKTAEAFQDYDKWAKASFTPMLMSTGARLGGEMGSPLEEKLAYRQRLNINYFKDFENYFAFAGTTEFDAYWKDIYTTWNGKFDISWQSVYFVVRRFKGIQLTPIDKGKIVDKTTYLKEFVEDDVPVVLFKGLGLSSDEWEKYDAWVKDWGYDVYIPLLLKVPGVTEFCRCWLSNVRREGSVLKPSTTTNPDYPHDLSIIYFENLKAYQSFLKSKELAAYEKNLVATFPGGLNYRWDNAFRLMRRFSK